MLRTGVMVGSGGSARSHRTSVATALCAALCVCGLSACGNDTHSQPGNLRICETTIPTGANIPLVARLGRPSGANPPAPARSRLPPPAAAPTGSYSAASYIRTSSSCDRGAVVVVTPASGASLVVTARSRDGGVAAIGLIVSAPITVRAWVGDRYQGELKLNP